MEILKAAHLAERSLVVEQTRAWAEGAAGEFKDTVALSIETVVDGHRMLTSVHLSLDDLVEFVTRVREEWRVGREAARATVQRVKS